MNEQSQDDGRVAIIGGGTMGADIAAIFLAGGWRVDVISPSPGTRASLVQRVSVSLRAMQCAVAAVERLTVGGTLASLNWSGLNLVIESVTEDLTLKQGLFEDMARLAPADLPLATNTSTFEIARVGERLADKRRMLGMHFFMPAHLVPLVEIIPCAQTDRLVVDNIMSMMHRLGKEPIQVRRDVPGFVGNRLQHALMREALYLMEEGVAGPEEIDIAVRYGFGFRYLACGPMMQKEMSGWDTNWRAGSALYPHLHNETVVPAGIEAMVRKGHIGMKALQGIWSWTEDSAAEERARINARLRAAMAILRDDPTGSIDQDATG